MASTILARSTVGHVDEPRPDNVRLRVGFVSLELTGKALELLAQTLNDAVRQRQRQRRRAHADLRLLLGRDAPVPAVPGDAGGLDG